MQYRYLGAAPLVSSPAVLTVAAEIVTVEARHQTFIRTASKIAAVPSAFDTPLDVKNVFTLAAGFITSCPTGSNLNIVANPPITMTNSAAGITANTVLQLSTTATGATFCAFTNGGVPGGTAFAPFTNGQCVVPQILAGITYLNLASAGPETGVLTDAITVAGPLVIAIS
jgi:Ferritin-like domain